MTNDEFCELDQERGVKAVHKPRKPFSRTSIFWKAFAVGTILVVVLYVSHALGIGVMGVNLFHTTGDSLTAGGGASKAASFAETCCAIGSEVGTGVSSSAHFQDHSGSVFPVPVGTSVRRDWNEYK
jgi:hypothetical protein